MWYIWLIVAGIFFIVEIATTGFLIFWLGIGSIFAMFTSFIINSIFVQTFVFVISSIILILLTKPLTKYIDTQKTVPTNSYSIISKTGIVIKDINSLNGTGQVKVNSEVWSAKSEENIIKDTEVEILKIEGVKLIVTPKNKSKVNI